MDSYMSYLQKMKLTLQFVILLFAILLAIWVIHEGFTDLSQEIRNNNKKQDDLISIFNKSTSSMSSAKEDY